MEAIDNQAEEKFLEEREDRVSYYLLQQNSCWIILNIQIGGIFDEYNILYKRKN